ncbi:MAG TPA: hypothetical protein IAB39_06380 [Candidatus Onthovicinus excrementipullorum]|nr:hypothetical protein [Candidatus Onthovicinus excrementipullorum]
MAKRHVVDVVSEGAAQLGLDSIELPLDEPRIVRNLEAGNPVVCAMGPGNFTKTGHFIALTDLEDTSSG